MLIGGWWLRAWWTRCRRRCRISLLSICMRRRLATCLGSGLVGGIGWEGWELGALGEGADAGVGAVGGKYDAGAALDGVDRLVGIMGGHVPYW